MGTQASFSTIVGTKTYVVGNPVFANSKPIISPGQYVGITSTSPAGTFYYDSTMPVPGGVFTGLFGPMGTLATKDALSTIIPSPPANPSSGTSSPGSNYMSTTGVIITLPAGSTVPTGWVPAMDGAFVFSNGQGKFIQVKVNDGQDINTYAPMTEGNYQIKSFDRSGMSATIYVVTKGQAANGDAKSLLIGYSGPGAPPPVVQPGQVALPMPSGRNPDDPNKPVAPVSNVVVPVFNQTQGPTVWKTPSGGVVYALPGSVIPTNWTVDSVDPYDAAQAWLVGDGQLAYPTSPQPNGGWYLDPATGQVTLLPAGAPIPQNWRPTLAPAGDTSGAAGLDPNFDPSKANIRGGSTSSKDWAYSIVPSVIVGLGAVGLTALAYMILTDPEGAKAYLVKFEAFKDLAVDSSALIFAMSAIVALSFAAYELYQALANNDWNFAKAVGSLTASVIETIARGLVDALETLGEDIGSWIETNILPSWLGGGGSQSVP